MEGELVSRVMLRSCAHIRLNDSADPWVKMVKEAVGEDGYMALLVDEPVDPSGSRCLYMMCDGGMGGADVDWVMRNTDELPVKVTLDLVLKNLRDRTSHLSKLALVSLLPKNSAAIRKAKASKIWKEWHRELLNSPK
jgi:hypothetical protein